MFNEQVNRLFLDLTKSLQEAKLPGKITVSLAGIDSIIKGKDAIGHLMQEWFFSWCEENNYKVIQNPSTQKFPDYFLDKVNNPKGMLEIKNFHYDKSPAFDVADFYAFIETLPNEIEKLYADYIVFGYRLDKNGSLNIPKVWKMKIWELVGRSRENNVTCQIRNKQCSQKGNKVLKNGNIDVKGRIQKFRPYNFKSASTKNRFDGPVPFLEALQNLIDHHHNTKDDYSNWLSEVRTAHELKFGQKLI